MGCILLILREKIMRRRKKKVLLSLLNFDVEKEDIRVYKKLFNKI